MKSSTCLAVFLVLALCSPDAGASTVEEEATLLSKGETVGEVVRHAEKLKVIESNESLGESGQSKDQGEATMLLQYGANADTCVPGCKKCGYNWYEKQWNNGNPSSYFTNTECECCGGTQAEKETCKSACSGYNMARGKAASASSVSHYGGAASLVVDGSTTTGFLHSDLEVSPWVQVDLGNSDLVAVVRTTMRDDERPGITLRNVGFSVTVDTVVCANNQPVVWVVGALTTDTVCGAALSGSKVRVSLPSGGRRFLQISEVEVYGLALLANYACYSNSGTNVYKYMNKCESCSGPGPSQCLSCADGDAFVMWNDTTKAGSCHTITTTNIVVTVPGSATAELAALPQISTKFFQKRVETMITRPDVIGGVPNETVGVRAECAGVKQIVCRTASSGNHTGTTSCTQSKHVQLLSVGADASHYGGKMTHQSMSADVFMGYYSDSSINQNGAQFINPCAPLTSIF